MILQLKADNDTFKCDIHLTVRVCITKGFFSEHVFIKQFVSQKGSFLNMSFSHCVFKIMILKMKKKY